MKKVLYAFAALAVLLQVASCSKELNNPSADGQKVNATFTVSAPGAVATKAISDGVAAANLSFAVYDESGNYLSDLSAYGNSHIVPGNAKTWKVTVPVVSGMTYKFVFFAKSAADNGFYAFDAAAKTLTVDYSKLAANNDNADAFYAMKQIAISSTFSDNVTLQRPLAQVNVGAADLAEAAYTLKTNNTLKLGVDLTDVYSQMNLLTGAVAGDPVDVSYAKAIRITEADQFISGYDRVAMVYALVGDKQLSDATINITAEGAQNTDAHNIVRSVPNLPLQRGYRTNILGNLFTGVFSFTVTTDADFLGSAYGDDNMPDYVATYTSLAALNAAMANGIHAVALDMTTKVEGDIVLPDTVKDIHLYILNDHFDDESAINVIYGGTAHPANLYVYAKKLYKMDGEVPDTHVEIYSYSYIETGTISTSGTTLVIQPYAYYGNLIIKKGSLKVEGKIAEASLEPEDPTESINVTIVKDAEKEINGQVIILNVTEGSTTISATNSEGDEASIPSGTPAAEQVPVVTVNVTTPPAAATTTSVNVNADVTNLNNNASTVTVDAAVENVETTGSGETNLGDNVTEEDGKIVYYVASIGETKYTSLVEAVNNVPDDGTETTIVMLKDHAVAAGVTIAAEKNIVLELNGKVVSGNTDSSTSYALITNKGTLVVQDNTDLQHDGTGAGTLTTYISNPDKLDVPGYASNTITNHGNLTVKSGKLVNNGDGYACYAIDNQTNGDLYTPVLHIEGGRMQQMRAYTYAVRMFCNSLSNDNTAVVSGGVIEGGYGFWLQTPNAKANKANLTISGGTINSRDGFAVYFGYTSKSDNRNIYVNITGGTINGTGLAIQGPLDGIFGNLSISGGEFVKVQVGADVEEFISGGIFGTKPSDDYLSFGYAAYEYGDKWKVSAMPCWIDSAASDEAFAAATDEVNKLISIDSPELLAKLAKNVNTLDMRYEGYTVKLTADIDLAEKMWAPIGIGSYDHNFRGTFDGDGKTISNLSVKHANAAGLFGCMHGGIVKNVNLDYVRVYSNHYAGAVVGWMEKPASDMMVSGCTVSGGWVRSVPEYVNNEWDNGDKAGGLVGFAYGGEYINNTVSGLSKVKAYRDLAGLIGYAQVATVYGNSVSDLTVCQSNFHAYKSEEITTYAEIIGRDGGENEVSENSFSNVTLKTSNK